MSLLRNTLTQSSLTMSSRVLGFIRDILIAAKVGAGPIGDAFVGLLQMTVLPYITFALISNIGRLTFVQGKRLAKVGTAVMLVLWLTGIAVFYLVTWAFPDWQSASFFSTTAFESQQGIDLLGLLMWLYGVDKTFDPEILAFLAGQGVGSIGIRYDFAMKSQRNPQLQWINLRLQITRLVLPIHTTALILFGMKYRTVSYQSA